MALVPPQHIYGFLFACLLPARLDWPVIDLHRAAPTAVFRHAKAGDLIVGTPLHWDLLQQVGLRLPEEVFGLTSAGPSTALTWQAPDTLGLSGLTEIYGATETGGIGTRSSGQAPFKLLQHLRPPNGQVTAPSRGLAPLDLQDKLDWIAPDLFHVLGRKDDVVQVAGVNVSPSEIRKVLEAFAGVSAVTVRPCGNRLKAFVVPDPALSDPAGFAERLQRHILQTLPAPARPTSLTFGSSLPRNSLGKLCDWLISTR
jgi:4-coumarate--CoA ligase